MHPFSRPWQRNLTLLLAALLVNLLVMLVPSSSTASAPHTTAPARHSTAHRGAEGFPSGSFITSAAAPSRFAIAADDHAAPVVVDQNDYPGVVRVATDLSSDVGRVTGATPTVVHDIGSAGRAPVIVGTIGMSAPIDALIKAGKLDVRSIVGKWETSLETVVDNPFPGVRRAFVIVGSDQRGTIYGAYDVSRMIGVSPWYWWDDVAPRHHDALYVMPGAHSSGTPAVKYRGFYLNDEDPQTGTWAKNTFGPGLAAGHPNGLTHEYYAKLFELALRLKANYLWPAEWGRAFALDDPQNQATATAYGFVMGTSHDAPMTCGIEEWNRVAVAAQRDADGNITKPGHDPYGGTGEWSYQYNAPAVKQYWHDCIQRMVDQNAEMVVTLGMRGNGDAPLSDDGGIDQMNDIIASQRQILAQVTGKDVTTIPQVLTLYKEVLRYWNEGLRPPDDVTVVFPDDNWGNIRELPDNKLPPRSGGYGLYYHFDYVGGTRNYKWVDTINLANTWEQLHQAYAFGDDRLWVANVGDVKNEEVPLQFFLDYAWNPRAISVTDLPDWVQSYATENFGTADAKAIADVLQDYSQMQSRRKPELLNRAYKFEAANPSSASFDDQSLPFSLNDYREMEQTTSAWQGLAARTDQIAARLPADEHDSYYELVQYEVDATANLYAMRNAEFTNILYAAQGRSATNSLATTAENLFAKDQAMSDYYNTQLAGGKWDGWQTQTHIDYGDRSRVSSGWDSPPSPDVLFPAVKRIDVPVPSEMGVAIDGAGGRQPRLDTIYQAEDATLSGAQVATNWGGYTGSGFANPLHDSGDYIEWTVNAPTAGTYTLVFRYANGGAAARPMDLTLNGASQPGLTFTPTGGWSNWSNLGATVELPAGSSTVRIADTGSRGANIDYLGVSSGAVDANPSATEWWPQASGPAVLPELSPYQTQPAQYFDIFNRGQTPFAYTVQAAEPWVHVSTRSGTVDQQTRVTVSVDWSRAPRGTTTVPITVAGAGKTVVVDAPVDNPTLARGPRHGFIEANGYVAMQADHYTSRSGNWLRLPRIGLTGAGMEPTGSTSPGTTLGADTPKLTYTTTLTTTGPVDIVAYLSPRNDVFAHGGLRYAIAVDDETPQVVNIQEQTGADDATMNGQWGRNVADNINRTVTTHTIAQAGTHTITFWAIDPTVVLQRLVLDAGGVEDSYLGPPESMRRP